MEQLNHNQRSLIRTTAFAVLRNGAQYYEWLKSKRHSDPLYAFLVGGIGSKYYEWCLSNEKDARKEDNNDRLRSQEDSSDKPLREKEGHKIERIERDRSRDRSASRSRSRSFRRRRSRSPPHRRVRSPNRLWEDRRRSDRGSHRREPDRRERERRRSRSPQGDRKGDVRHRKLYAWSSEEESVPKPTEILKQKLESMKQKLREDSPVKLGA